MKRWLFLSSNRRRKVTAAHLQGLLLSPVLYQGSWMFLNQTSSNPAAALFRHSVSRHTERKKSNPPQSAASLFLLFSNIIGDMAGTKHTVGVRWRNAALYTCLAMLFELFTSGSRFEGCQQWCCMSLKAEQQQAKVASHCSAVFNALLVCPLIPPLVSLFCNTRKKYNLTCNFFVKGTNTIFFSQKQALLTNAGFIPPEVLSVTDVTRRRCASNTKRHNSIISHCLRRHHLC